ncbi:MAG TPA: Npt1/Npt2 family nucleotide transporter [Candidatus Babeliales bacterium]|nr:Npt1/Npt2 family nucleotide transporter [Candidatus Babeliales bacterium]
MVYRTINYFYPDLSHEDIKKFGILSATFFLIVGAYWLLRLLKDVVFFKTAFPISLGWEPGYGRLMQPTVKFLSPFVIIVLVLIYSKLLDWFKKEKVFFIICSIYGTIFGVIGVLLALSSFYSPAILGKTVLAVLGWVSYFSVESFGSLLITLFWSYSVSVCTTDEAKRGFPLIVAGAQIGAIGGSVLTLFSDKIGGAGPLFIASSFFTFLVVVAINVFTLVVPANRRVGNKVAAKIAQKKEGFIEGFTSGLTLIIKNSYLIGVLIVSTFYEIAGQIVDYQMKSQVDVYPGFAKFQGIYGVATNSLSFFVALLGTSYLLKRFGTRICLLIYPVSFAMALIAFYLYYSFGSPSTQQLLWTTLVVMVVIKGVSYAVNNPTKDMMYIPTSRDAKFKSKGWIDMFGGRSAKSAGTRITNAFKHNFNQLMIFGTLFGLGVIGVWLIAAFMVGKKNAKLVRDGEIIE